VSLFHEGNGSEMGTRAYITEMTLCPPPGLSDTQVRLYKQTLSPSLSLRQECTESVLLVYRM